MRNMTQAAQIQKEMNVNQYVVVLTAVNPIYNSCKMNISAAVVVQLLITEIIILAV